MKTQTKRSVMKRMTASASPGSHILRNQLVWFQESRRTPCIFPSTTQTLNLCIFHGLACRISSIPIDNCQPLHILCSPVASARSHTLQIQAPPRRLNASSCISRCCKMAILQKEQRDVLAGKDLVSSCNLIQYLH